MFYNVAQITLQLSQKFDKKDLLDATVDSTPHDDVCV
jgi:hypothetical protein